MWINSYQSETNMIFMDLGIYIGNVSVKEGYLTA